MNKLKFLGAILLFSLSIARAECYYIPLPVCTLDTEGQAPSDNCASKSPWFMSYQLKKDERIYNFRKDCSANWGKNAWNIIVYTTGSWKPDGTTKQVAEWRAGADHALMSSVITGNCKSDPWLHSNAICSQKEFYYTVASSLIGKNGLPDVLYNMYHDILGLNINGSFPNTAALIPEEKRKEILIRAAMFNLRDHDKKIPYPWSPSK